MYKNTYRTHFCFYDSGGPGFFSMPPVWSQERKKKRQTTTAQNSGALLRPYLTLFGLAGTRSPVLPPLDKVVPDSGLPAVVAVFRFTADLQDCI